MQSSAKHAEPKFSNDASFQKCLIGTATQAHFIGAMHAMIKTSATILTSEGAVHKSDASWEYGPIDADRLKERAVFYAHTAGSGEDLIGENVTPALIAAHDMVQASSCQYCCAHCRTLLDVPGLPAFHAVSWLAPQSRFASCWTASLGAPSFRFQRRSTSAWY